MRTEDVITLYRQNCNLGRGLVLFPYQDEWEKAWVQIGLNDWPGYKIRVTERSIICPSGEWTFFDWVHPQKEFTRNCIGGINLSWAIIAGPIDSDIISMIQARIRLDPAIFIRILR